MAIAFLPIDIDVRLPDETKLLEYCEKYKIPPIEGKVDTASYWDIVPVIGRLPGEKWYDIRELKATLHERYNPGLGECHWANDIDKVFPEIPYMLNQLPFTELTMVSMLVQKTYVPHHLDPHVGDNVLDPFEISLHNEPHRYNIQLTKHGQNAFFVSQEKDGEKLYPNITRERPCFAFCERYHWHGSDYIGPNKVQLIVFGIVDRKKHRATIYKNLAKYKDDAIIFPDPENPEDLRYHHDSY